MAEGGTDTIGLGLESLKRPGRLSDEIAHAATDKIASGEFPPDAPACAGADPAPRAPRFTLPSNACDCHVHVFGPQDRYPYTRHRTYTPPPAPLSALQSMMAITGTERAAIVQPSVYGTDNRATLDAAAAGR